jgi:hypothetical protein
MGQSKSATWVNLASAPTLGFTRANGLTFTTADGSQYGFTYNGLPDAYGPMASQRGATGSLNFGPIESSIAPSESVPAMSFDPSMVDDYISGKLDALDAAGRPTTFLLGEGQQQVAQAARANGGLVQALEIWPDNMIFPEAYDESGALIPGSEAKNQMSIDYNSHLISRLYDAGYEFQTIGTCAADGVTVTSPWYQTELDTLSQYGVTPQPISWTRTGGQ